MLCKKAFESRYQSEYRTCVQGLCRLWDSHYRAKKSKHLFSLLISLAEIVSPLQTEVGPRWLMSRSKRPSHLTTAH